MGSRTGSVGDYIVTAKIGSGSFATVYRGHHKVTNEKVAIKAIQKEKLNAKLQENLQSEISLLQSFSHPNIVSLISVKHTEKHIYLILEYCGGGDLQKFIKRHGTLSESQARVFLRQLASGLAVLWNKQCIHRDLKPQNLLLSSDSYDATLKIADFGFARHLAQASLAETLCGSPLYMAPEILKFQKYDAKADLWSVGTILFEMVTGKPPFNGANHVQLLSNIERQELRFPKDLVVSNDCVVLLQGLLKRNPALRIGFEDFFDSAFISLNIQEALALTQRKEDSLSPVMSSVAGADTVPPLSSTKLGKPASSKSAAVGRRSSTPPPHAPKPPLSGGKQQNVRSVAATPPRSTPPPASTEEYVLVNESSRTTTNSSNATAALPLVIFLADQIKDRLSDSKECIKAICMYRLAAKIGASDNYVKSNLKECLLYLKHNDISSISNIERTTIKVLFETVLQYASDGASLEVLGQDTAALELYNNSLVLSTVLLPLISKRKRDVDTINSFIESVRSRIALKS